MRGEDISKPRDHAVAFKLHYDPALKARSSDNSDKFCTHCNREGHVESGCFQLHGFPEWWGDRPRGGRGLGRGALTTGRGGGRAGG